MKRFKSWRVFNKEDLDFKTTKNLRTGKRWLANGTIRGRVIEDSQGEVEDILVDMKHWYGDLSGSERDPEAEALELFT